MSTTAVPVRTWSFTILGSPKTKKNTPQIVLMKSYGKGQPCPHCRKAILPKPFPSAAFRTWAKGAVMVPSMNLTRQLPDQPYNCRALFYRDRLQGDAVGFYQALADFLEERGVLSDDKWIVSWDGSQLLKDAVRPRVELTLEALGAPEPKQESLL